MVGTDLGNIQNTKIYKASDLFDVEGTRKKDIRYFMVFSLSENKVSW